jgi:beta-exotoxin I transport system ATP-binding protein
VNVINTECLSRWYGKRVGIETVDLQVNEGDIFGFLGPNGAGKTTTIRVLLGLLRPSSGAATILGLDCWRQSHRIKRQIGYLPGDLRLYPWFTAESALRLVGRIRGQDLAQFGAVLTERFLLDPRLVVRKMSRGTRQKLGIVLALAHRPQLVVLDEPTFGLDPLMRDELARCLRELAADGHAVFFSSHSLSEVEQLCDRVAVVRAGRIVANEQVDTLRRKACRAVSLRFRDIESANNIAIPDFLGVVDRTGTTWQCDLVGSAPELVRWAAQQPIDDIAIGPPNLESLFRRFYQAGEESP